MLLQNYTAMVKIFLLLHFNLLTKPVRQLVSGKGHRCMSEPITDRGGGGEWVKRKLNARWLL